jgi:hypothetical protein
MVVLKQKSFCGSAAAQCGKALPYRNFGFFLGGYASLFEAQPLTYFQYELPERQSLSALCGKAAITYPSP